MINKYYHNKIVAYSRKFIVTPDPTMGAGNSFVSRSAVFIAAASTISHRELLITVLHLAPNRRALRSAVGALRHSRSRALASVQEFRASISLHY